MIKVQWLFEAMRIETLAEKPAQTQGTHKQAYAADDYDQRHAASVGFLDGLRLSKPGLRRRLHGTPPRDFGRSR